MSNLIEKNAQLPAFMRAGPVGMELISDYISPPRLKIVQKQSGAPFSDLFSPGDVIAVPLMQMIAPMTPEGGEIIPIIPLFFYPEWCTWNPIEMKGQGSSIRERSLDPKSDIARKAQSPDYRREPHPDMPSAFVRHVEHLNFVCMLTGSAHELQGLPVVLTFARAEHRAGSTFATLIRLRNAPIYGCQFIAQVPKKQRSNQKGQWYGIDVSNPPEGSEINRFVQDEQQFNELAALHESFAEAHRKGVLRAEYDDEDANAGESGKAEF